MFKYRQNCQNMVLFELRKRLDKLTNVLFCYNISFDNSITILHTIHIGGNMCKIVIFNKYTSEKRCCNMCEILKRIKNKTASDLLKEYHIKSEPPIDIALLLENIGISLISKDFSNLEKQSGYENNSILGAAISKDDDLAIFYKENDTYHRKIFTIAHELGHCCRHSENLKIEHIELRTLDCPNQHEMEANIFAGELLIPYNILKDIYDDFLIPSLKSLSKIFNVSTNVMAARLDYLNLSYYKDTDINEE